MMRKDEAAAYLKNGNPPSTIARMMNISVASVMQYLCAKIGEGDICRWDVVASVNRALRQEIEQAYRELGKPSDFEISQHLKKKGLSFSYADVNAYIKFRNAAMADIYECLRALELSLHGYAKRNLIRKYGDDWWRELPLTIRIDCVTRMESDGKPATEPYCYTTFIHLKDIYESQWEMLSTILPSELRADRKKFRQLMDRLNHIRNTVMHPVRMTILDDDDFMIAYRFRAQLRSQQLVSCVPYALGAGEAVQWEKGA
jgi:Swt1-like HEPN